MPYYLVCYYCTRVFGERKVKPIVSYLDFREYLRDFYLEKKKSSGFTFRDFAKAAGFSSPNFIKLVIDAKANLAPPSVARLCDAMGLKNSDRRYFKHLVSFGQAKTIEKKIGFLEKLKSVQSSVVVGGLTDDQFSYFSKWYHPIIREILSVLRFDGDFDQLAAFVNPPITPKEAEESVELLENLHLIEKDESGRFVPTDRFLTSAGLGTGALAIRNAQKTMSQLAARAIEVVPPEQRDISGVTVSISENSLDTVRAELEKCRRRIFEIAAQDKTSNCVFRVNLHMFPVSGKIPDKELLKTRDGHGE